MDKRKRPLIGISSCLLGENVRYNRGNTQDKWLSRDLSKRSSLKAVYRLLFEQIIVGDLNNSGVREVNFVLRDFRSTEDGNLVRFSEKMVPLSGRFSNCYP